MATHSSILAWRIPWTEEPGGYSPWGHKRVGMTLQLNTTSSVAQSCPALCDPMDCSMSGLSVHHQLPELTQTHVYRVGDAIQPSHPLSAPSPALSLSQHQSLFQWKVPTDSFPMSQFFASGVQSIGASASASVLPMNIQDWFPLGLTGLISLQFP